MKKLKRFWQENSVLLVLFIILVACLIAISVVVVKYFVGDAKTKYGDRLDGIESYPFGDKEIEELKNNMSDDLIGDIDVRTSGKIIYVTIIFAPKTSLVEAQGKALASLEFFSEEILGFYDIQYMIRTEATEDTEGFNIMGSHNISGTGGIVWNNNKAVE